MRFLTWFRRCPPPRQPLSHTYTIELFEDAAGKWRSRIRHVNSNKLWTSEAYSSKAECMETATNFAKEAKPLVLEILE